MGAGRQPVPGACLRPFSLGRTRGGRGVLPFISPSF